MPQRENSFTKAFLPGLILGIVVGGFAGAYLTGSTGETIQPKSSNGQPLSQRPRDGMETPPVPATVPEVIDQGTAPADKPVTPPANDPSTPPVTPPSTPPGNPPVDPKAPPANPPANTPGEIPGGTPNKPVEPK